MVASGQLHIQTALAPGKELQVLSLLPWVLNRFKSLQSFLSHEWIFAVSLINQSWLRNFRLMWAYAPNVPTSFIFCVILMWIGLYKANTFPWHSILRELFLQKTKNWEYHAVPCHYLPTYIIQWCFSEFNIQGVSPHY